MKWTIAITFALALFAAAFLEAQVPGEPGVPPAGDVPGPAGETQIGEDVFEEISLPLDVAGRIGNTDITARRVIQELTESSIHRRNMLMDIVQRELIDKEAQARNVAVFPNDMAEARASRIEAAGGEEAYADMIRRGRLDPVLEERRLQYQILLRKLIERDPEAVVTDDEIRQAFEQRHAERYNLQVILVPDPQQAGNIYDQLTRGTDFGLLAARFSQHPSRQNAGILANVLPAQLPEALRARVIALNRGAFTDPISHQGGSWIVRKLEHIPANPDADFAAERGQIAEALKMMKMQQLSRTYLERLARKHKVQINIDLFGHPVPEGN